MSDEEKYEGPICFIGAEGWHYTVVEDEDARVLAASVAQAHIDYATKKKDPARLAAAQTELADVQLRSFEMPGERLFSFGDGTYRLAREGDPSNQEQFHRQYAVTQMDGDLQPALRVSAEERRIVEELLRQHRGEQ